MSSWFPKSSYLVSLPMAFIFSNQSSTQKNQIVLFTWHPQMMKSFWDVLASFFLPRQYTFHSVKSEMQRDPTKRPSYSIPVCLLSLSLSLLGKYLVISLLGITFWVRWTVSAICSLIACAQQTQLSAAQRTQLSVGRQRFHLNEQWQRGQTKHYGWELNVFILFYNVSILCI